MSSVDGHPPQLRAVSPGGGRRRQLIDAGRPVQGVFVKLPAYQVLDLIDASDYDFVIVDREHSQLSEHQALDLLRHAETIGLPALLRLPRVDAGEINRALEAGACGIQLSSVRSVAQVRELVAATRVAPDGRRSTALTHVGAGYGARDLADYVAGEQADPPILVAQIETEQTDDDLGAILAAGADVAFIGMTDLAVDVGHDPARLGARVATVVAAVRASGTLLGGAGVVDPAVRYAADTNDIALFRSACGVAQGAPATGRRDAVRRRAEPAPPDPRAALEALVVEFSHRLDMAQGVTVHELFVETGSYVLDGDELKGREAIRAGYLRRLARGSRVSRHLISNIRVELLDEDTARVDSIWVVYADDGEPVLPSSPPLLVADIADRCVRVDGEWRFVRRELRTVFRSEGAVVSPAWQSIMPGGYISKEREFDG